MLLKDGQMFEIFHGDCIEEMSRMPAECVSFAIFSPPFPALFAYQSSLADIGNSEDIDDGGDGRLHLSFFYTQLARVLKPGRVAIVHVAQIPRMKRVSPLGGLHDFRGTNIRIAKRAGLVYEYDWLIRKNPQSQALRTRSRELQFAGLESDRANSRGALGDYLLKFSARGENKVPVDSEGEITRNNWIDWAENAWWDDIQETDTLNVQGTKTENETRHICPLQLEVIRRMILLYTNPGELVFSPFAGIGSEGFVALGGESPKTKKKIFHQRRFYGCELKAEYHAAAIKNCERALRDFKVQQKDLFAEV